MIPRVHSIKTVDLQYSTGERPVLVLCSDRNEYVCKYVHGGNSANKLVAEVVGSVLAKAWRIPTPDTAFVEISPAHWSRGDSGHFLAYGSRRMERVVDVTPTTIGNIPASRDAMLGLIHIALFDFWLANEDRNANNANLMYDMGRGEMVSIDYGCIFNTATFDAPLCQLTSTDSILSSDLYHQLNTGPLPPTDGLKQYFKSCIGKCRRVVARLIDNIPEVWGVSRDVVAIKLEELVSPIWVNAVWENYMECMHENFIV